MKDSNGMARLIWYSVCNVTHFHLTKTESLVIIKEQLMKRFFNHRKAITIKLTKKKRCWKSKKNAKKKLATNFLKESLCSNISKATKSILMKSKMCCQRSNDKHSFLWQNRNKVAFQHKHHAQCTNTVQAVNRRRSMYFGFTFWSKEFVKYWWKTEGKEKKRAAKWISHELTLAVDKIRDIYAIFSRKN